MLMVGLGKTSGKEVDVASLRVGACALKDRFYGMSEEHFFPWHDSYCFWNALDVIWIYHIYPKYFDTLAPCHIN